MGIRDHPTAPRSPWQNGHAERLIGSVRRECLDHIVIFGEAHLRWILADYAGYYNELRTHLSWGRIRRAVDRCNGSASSLLSRSSAAFIINIAGRSFRQAQRLGIRCPSPLALGIFPRSTVFVLKVGDQETLTNIVG
jgi:hypothetical protein